MILYKLSQLYVIMYIIVHFQIDRSNITSEDLQSIEQ